MSDETDDLKRVREACQTLIEHFDTVQIFVTRHEPEQEGGTINVAYGEGNWFARYGFVQDYMIRQEEMTRMRVQRDNCGE